MDRKIFQLMVMVGALMYMGFLVLQLFYFFSAVGLLLWPVVSILAQVALGLPILLWPRFREIAHPYTVALCALAAVLAVSGYLGMPDAAGQALCRGTRISIEKSLRSNAEDQGAREQLEIALEMAEADSDEEREAIRKRAKKFEESISKEEKRELDKERKVLRAERDLASFDGEFDSYDAEVGRQMNGLVLIGAFLAAFGAYLLTREPSGTSKPTSRPEVEEDTST